jgi:hypothetical protein
MKALNKSLFKSNQIKTELGHKTRVPEISFLLNLVTNIICEIDHVTQSFHL